MLNFLNLINTTDCLKKKPKKKKRLCAHTDGQRESMFQKSFCWNPIKYESRLEIQHNAAFTDFRGFVFF